MAYHEPCIRRVLATTTMVAVAVAVIASAEAVAQTPADAAAPSKALPEVGEVVEKLDDLYRSKSSHGRMRMTVVKARGSRTLELEQWSRGEDQFLVVIREPAREAGTATLKTEEGLWNYAPRADRLIRIPSGLLSDNWMGSHLTNEDLVRDASYDKDYDTSIAWAPGAVGERLSLVLVPKPDVPVVYEKLVFTVRADDWLPIRADYYDDGVVVREMRFSGVREMGGRRIPTIMELHPLKGRNAGEKTRVEYVEMTFDAEVDQTIFTRRGLRRASGRR